MARPALLFVSSSVVVSITLCGCGKESPAGTALVDWSYTPTTSADGAPTPLTPPRNVTENVTWTRKEGAPVPLRVDTEIGEQLVGGMRWHTPRHVHISLAQPTKGKMPQVDCMPEPPGNKIVGDKMVPPVGDDGTTPVGLVGCFLLAPDPDGIVVEVNGDGHTRVTIPKH